MEVTEIAKNNTYAEFKEALDTEFNSAAESFNRIGYLLKIARDTEILAESGYATVAEFAAAEYGLRKDDVSRFIAINDRYSRNGYSEELDDRWKGYGRAKLQEMLSLPQEIVESIPLETTKAQIQEIKKEYKEEQDITDIEVMLEDKNEQQEIMDNNLTKILHQLLHNDKEMFKNIVKIRDSIELPSKLDAIYEVIAPTGIATHIVRIAGAGRYMLTITDIKDIVATLNMRTNEREEYTFNDIGESLRYILEGTGKNVSKAYESIYNEPYEEKEKVAPVQQEKSTVKNDTANEQTISADISERKPETETQDNTDESTEKGVQKTAENLSTDISDGISDNDIEKASEMAVAISDNITPRVSEVEKIPEEDTQVDTSEAEIRISYIIEDIKKAAGRRDYTEIIWHAQHLISKCREIKGGNEDEQTDDR